MIVFCLVKTPLLLKLLYIESLVNKVNRHKEYFKLPLEDIEKVVIEKYDENAEFDYDTVDENWLISKDC